MHKFLDERWFRKARQISTQTRVIPRKHMDNSNTAKTGDSSGAYSRVRASREIANLRKHAIRRDKIDLSLAGFQSARTARKQIQFLFFYVQLP